MNSAPLHVEKPIVFVTSFKRDMYSATGVHLLDSFSRYCHGMLLMACLEEFGNQPPQCSDPRIHFADMTEHPVLRNWLSANADIIPHHLGGEAQPCACTVVGFGIDEHHVEGCRNAWYNRNAARWYRKAVALHIAAVQFPKGQLVWLDSDCRFTKPLHAETVLTWFGDGAGFYCKSPMRKVLESGVFGLNLGAGGSEFLSDLLTRYSSGSFRDDPRWDDGYQIQSVIDKRPDLNMADLAPHALSYRAEVIATSPLGEYLEHYRGVHGPVLHLMT